MTSTTKTKAAEYDTIEGIEDMVPSLWSPVKVAYDQYAIWGITYWRPKRQWFYAYASNREDQQLYEFKEGNFPRLNMRDIKDLLLLLVQKKLSNLERNAIYDLNVALRMFTRHVVILKRVEDLQLLRMDYLPKRRWSKLDRKRSRIIIKAIDQQLFERRLMRNLKKFVGIQNVRNHNRLIVVLGIANQNGNGNVVAAQAEGNGNGNNNNKVRCYNCRGMGHLARNCTVGLRRRDATYLQTPLLIAQIEEAGI
nr:hypothetical protein [Tanacetum cinerariifolium]